MSSVVSYGFLTPPALFIVLCLAGALIALRLRRIGLAIVLPASLCLFAAATPALSSYLLQRIEAKIPATPDFRSAQAIVVLGGDQRFGDGGRIPDTLGPLSLERLFFAAAAYHQQHLPVAVSGGRASGAHASVAELMKPVLERDFGVPVFWGEDRSRTTYENAIFTAELLRPQNIGTVILVTQAWHLPRAIWSFERAGLRALPWNAPRTAMHMGGVGDFLPSIAALHDSFYALHELIGGIYYRLRH